MSVNMVFRFFELLELMLEKDKKNQPKLFAVILNVDTKSNSGLIPDTIVFNGTDQTSRLSHKLGWT